MQLTAEASDSRLHSPGADICRQPHVDLAGDGEMDWAALLRKLDALDASYRS